MADFTQVVAAAELGDSQAAEQLLPLVYQELRSLAVQQLAHERQGQTLQATDLVHEVWLRLVDSGKPQKWDSRRHFFGAAAEAMRRILVEQARQKRSLKRGGGRVRIDLEHARDLPQLTDDSQVLALHEAISALESEHARKAQLVKLRYFAGMTLEEAAQALDISLATAKRDWMFARVWLFRQLQP